MKAKIFEKLYYDGKLYYKGEIIEISVGAFNSLKSEGFKIEEIKEVKKKNDSKI